VFEFIEGGGDGVDDGADVPGAAEGLGHDLGVVGLIIDDEDLRGESGGVGRRLGHGGSLRRRGENREAKALLEGSKFFEVFEGRQRDQISTRRIEGFRSVRRKAGIKAGH
jgi:hypothetical protein